ncbi:hypothetical protein X801_06212 [Opisthorchis viverrini]|uniref:FERM C-terminal PH-like domain-containing protein n=1 Tax=Opisthorchis viverrini TaxID=6198 RepID=A0A1S8WU31_OPIVI|nr:hypothetical protein X801_06212 [Opisthorchis viverrini]
MESRECTKSLDAHHSCKYLCALYLSQRLGFFTAPIYSSCTPRVSSRKSDVRNRGVIIEDKCLVNARQVTEHSFCFVLPNKSACKNLWKSAVEHHTFFRLTDRSQPPPKRKQLFRLRSRFHASFRTEYQLQNPDLFGSSSFRKKKKPVSSGMSSPTATSPPPSSGDRFGKAATPGITRTASSFRRTPSKRFNSRPSFSNRSALEERRAKRHRVPPSEETLQSNAFDKARTVVNVERACLRDPNWVPSGSPGSSGTGPRIRTRPVEYPPKSSPTPSPIAVRVTPQLSRRQAPSPPVKSASKPNGAGVPVNRCPAEECIAVRTFADAIFVFVQSKLNNPYTGYRE